MRSLLLLRPEPALSRSAERARRLGITVITCPLFRIEPVAWAVDEPDSFDGLLLTSANAVRYAGEGLARLRHLPVHAVGEATAAAAREAGFAVVTVGTSGVDEVLGNVAGAGRLLHLAGEYRHGVSRKNLEIRTVYRASTIDEPHLPPMDGLVAAIHSPRAGGRLAELADSRSGTAIAAISAEAAARCGAGWQRVAVADRPTDERLLALAAALCHTSDE